MLALEAEAASESEEDELLEDVEAGSAGADSDARKIGAFRVGARGCDSTVWDCWACMSEADPAIRKLIAATRHARPKKLRLLFIF